MRTTCPHCGKGLKATLWVSNHFDVTEDGVLFDEGHDSVTVWCTAPETHVLSGEDPETEAIREAVLADEDERARSR